MLVITRSSQQKIIIGHNDVSIKVLSISNNQVKLGIEASSHIIVNREEIYNRIQAQGNINGKC